MANKLTIGIPTFNRKEAAISCLKNLNNNFSFKEIDVLLIDNCSEDGTFEFLKKKYEDTPYRIIRNNKNFKPKINCYKFVCNQITCNQRCYKYSSQDNI